MAFKIRVPGPTNYKGQKEFCKSYGIKYKPEKYAKALKALDIPNGGLIDDARLPVFRAFMKG